MTLRQPIGNLIRLRQEYTEQYIILHQNVFPSVLERIARSNIGNYSIFHSEGILFGFYDYLGSNYKKDMKQIGEDESTRQWWKLTEPMQNPFRDRKVGEWWSGLEHIHSYSRDILKKTFTRKALRAADLFIDVNEYQKLFTNKMIDNRIARAETFRHRNEIYLYLEIEDGEDGTIHPLKVETEWPVSEYFKEMKEVFHTDGCVVRKAKRVFVTGCFDMLHSGHIAFLKEAASFGDLYIGIGSDANVSQLKGRYPVNTQDERKYMLDSVRFVHRCMINKGWGIMDFLKELDEVRPDVFVVNEDGHTPEKEDLCSRLGIAYKVLKRIPEEGLPARSTTDLRTECNIPFRIDLAGGWLDQPFVSKLYPGPVLTISIEPTLEFNDRSGMASSTRQKAVELWKTDLPSGDPEKLAKVLFSYDNPPGTIDVSGSQDALGIVLPGLNRLDYSGNYWPDKITSVHQEDILQWLEEHLYMITLGPRTGDYTVVENSRVDETGARNLSLAADRCWNSILSKDAIGFGRHFRESFEAQIAMFPNMADEGIYNIIERYKDKAMGWKLSGAGGGGYLILVAEHPIPGAFQIKIRRRNTN